MINAKPNNVTSGIVAKVEKLLEKKFYLEEKTPLLLAVSGGVDSIVMLDILFNISKKKKYKLFVCHYNHSLRKQSSDDDERFVLQLAASYGIKCFTAKGKVKQYAEKHRMSIEEAARHLRYMYMIKTARDVSCQHIVTAHTSDDCTETFLINLFRGTGLTGLAGIQRKRVVAKNISIIRPFIDLKKSDLIEYAARKNLKWRDDETNLLMDYTRNKIRLDLLPKLVSDYNSGIVENISRSSKLIGGADEFIREHVSNELEEVVSPNGSDKISVNIPLLQTYSEFIQGEILHQAIAKYFQLQATSLKLTDMVLSLMSSDIGSHVELPNNLIVVKDRRTLKIQKQQSAEKVLEIIKREGNFKIGKNKISLRQLSRKEVKFTRDKAVEYFDYDLIPINLIVRSWNDGDKFQPLGMRGTMKVSDFLINEKVPLFDKQQILLLATKSEIIWVCGMRMSEKYKITKETKRMLEARIVYNEKRIMNN